MAQVLSDYDENPDHVRRAIRLIEEGLIPAMEKILVAMGKARVFGYRFAFDSKALGMFRRRYRMAITKAIKDFPDMDDRDHLAFLVPVMRSQAGVAASIAAFKAIKAKNPPGAKPGRRILIDKDALQLATHALEHECRELVIRATAAAGAEKAKAPGKVISIYCS